MHALYESLAPWWPLLSPAEDYEAEAEVYLGLLTAARNGVSPGSLLELGSGAGHLASHLPATVDVELLDLAEGMLSVSQSLNPNRTHHRQDMRSAKLPRTFEAVLLHDAVMYLLTEADLAATLAVAAAHLSPGGAVLVVPDVVSETFEPLTQAGGHDGPDGRGARMLEWHWDPDPSDTRFSVEMSVLLRSADGTVQAVHETHEMGLFPRRTFVRLLREAGLEPLPPDPFLAVSCGEVFVARKPD